MRLSVKTRLLGAQRRASCARTLAKPKSVIGGDVAQAGCERTEIRDSKMAAVASMVRTWADGKLSNRFISGLASPAQAHGNEDSDRDPACAVATRGPPRRPGPRAGATARHQTTQIDVQQRAKHTHNVQGAQPAMSSNRRCSRLVWPA